MLAADGTKIGINVSHSTVVPTETPTVQTPIDPCHRRNERAFISYSQCAQDKARSRDPSFVSLQKSSWYFGNS